MSYSEVITWSGPDRTCRLEEMTREELIEAITDLMREVQSYRRPGMARAVAVGQVELMRRGEWPRTGPKS